MPTNVEMDQMITALAPLLDCRGLVGYAAARNTRLLRGACAEYLEFRDALVRELGTPETNEDGGFTGRFMIAFDSPSFREFENRLSEIAQIDHDFEPFTISVKDAMDSLTGTQMIELEWMLED